MSETKTIHDLLEHSERARRLAQAVAVEALVRNCGGVRKAAAAIGWSPGNFANIKSGKRKLPLPSIKKLSEKLADVLAKKAFADGRAKPTSEAIERIRQ